eukprot:TsM_000717200 transcript=TsM_000717200 gene=TsM_000717200
MMLVVVVAVTLMVLTQPTLTDLGLCIDVTIAVLPQLKVIQFLFAQRHNYFCSACHFVCGWNCVNPVGSEDQCL